MNDPMPRPPWPGPAILFVPASNPRAMEKAKRLAASHDGPSAIILDLEDAVAPAAKDGAREAMRQAFGRHDGAPPLAVRVNAPDTPWFAEDLLAARALRPRAVVLPKVEGPDDLALVETALAESDAPPGLAIWAMIETPRGVSRVDAIAACGGRLEALIVGTNDLVAATGVSIAQGRAHLHPWLMAVVLAARAEGISVLDGVRNDWRDGAAFEAEAREGAAMGFDGKTLIHPDQIAPTLAAHAPGSGDIERARRIAHAFAAVGEDVGVVTLDGAMVERLHLDAARRLLARVERPGADGARSRDVPADGAGHDDAQAYDNADAPRNPQALQEQEEPDR